MVAGGQGCGRRGEAARQVSAPTGRARAGGSVPQPSAFESRPARVMDSAQGVTRQARFPAGSRKPRLSLPLSPGETPPDLETPLARVIGAVHPRNGLSGSRIAFLGDPGRGPGPGMAIPAVLPTPTLRFRTQLAFRRVEWHPQGVLPGKRLWRGLHGILADSGPSRRRSRSPANRAGARTVRRSHAAPVSA